MQEYTREYADNLVQRLLALPAPDRATEKLNKQGVVEHILAALEKMIERGFTIPQIAESMRGEGFDITTPTLKSYLQRIRAKSGGKKTKKTPKSNRPAPVPSSAPTRPREPEVTAASGSPAGTSDGKAAEKPRQPKNTSSEFLDTDRARL
jgi:hypothetical protein